MLPHFGTLLDGDIKEFLNKIAASLFAIPCLYIIYELGRRFSQKRLNKEIFDYVKVIIDTEILSIVMILIKAINSYEARDTSSNGIQWFLSLEELNVRGMIEDCEYLGFQVFKN